MVRGRYLRAYVIVLMVLLETLERRGDEDGAYKLYDDAVRLSPDNALVRYRRAKMLISAKKYAVSLRRRAPLSAIYGAVHAHQAEADTGARVRRRTWSS